jgi:hypothetical protein
MNIRFILPFFLLNLLGCGQKNADTLFVLLAPEDTGIDFNNKLIESDSLNVLDFDYLYNGAGVAIGDFNRDGLPDIFFSGNQVSCRLYLNEGNMEFRDVTKQAGLETHQWAEGVTLVDLNNDGYLDIYISVSSRERNPTDPNLLYMNKGLDGEGIPVFGEEAAAYGIDDRGYNTQAQFFDYDRDGDLDLYILSNAMETFQRNTSRPREMGGRGKSTDKLYRNNGDNSFTDISKAAGILIEGYGLGVAISDIDGDGWPDIYVANDFLTNDLLYMNNGDGTFTNKIAKMIKHQSFNAMGVDMADYNNDGLVDIVVLDMMPPDNLRQKTMFAPTENYDLYFTNLGKGYEPQVVRNTLQLNRGDGSFSEIGQLAGIYQTDWSWAPLFADFDNDGWKDLFVSNGYGKDITDMDFVDFSRNLGPFQTPEERKKILLDGIGQLGEVSIPSFIYKNRGDLTFEDVSVPWGITHPAISNGAAFADLDNDGDLDLVLNNLNKPAFIYENQLNREKGDSVANTNFLKIKLKGTAPNIGGIGAKIHLFYTTEKGKAKQYYEHYPSRGYKSYMDQQIHFGLGGVAQLDSLQIIWPDGRMQQLYTVTSGQTLLLDYQQAEEPGEYPEESPVPVFEEISEQLGLAHVHQAKEYIDFKSQRLIHHKQSEFGPGMAVGDVNGDGREDFFIGGSAGFPGKLYMQEPQGSFSSTTLGDSLSYDDMGCLFFDANGDGFLDLYVASGGSRYPVGAPEYGDRLYINDGKGHLAQVEGGLPEMLSSSSVVIAADYDQDGDLDLFVGGRAQPKQYPLPAPSYLLNNNDGIFTDVTPEEGPELVDIGLVTDALWTDWDGDGKMDLILTGEWMPITLLRQVLSPDGQRTFEKADPPGLMDSHGWWNSLKAGDFDGDGDTDYMAGNLGLNTRWKASEREPLSLYAKDFDGNGSMDPIMFQYLQGEKWAVPGRGALTGQIPSMKGQFTSYRTYASTPFKNFFTPEQLENALVLHSYNFSTSLIENKGDGDFTLNPLPTEAQFSPVFGMSTEDFNRDGHLDLLMIGNFYGNETITGPHDASQGNYLLGNGDGTFWPVPVQESGWKVPGNARSLIRLQAGKGEPLYLASQYADTLKVYQKVGQEENGRGWYVLPLHPLDAWAQLTYKDGRKVKKEFYYGDSYLSQSSRTLIVDDQVESVTITDFQGKQREVLREEWGDKFNIYRHILGKNK